MSGNEARVGIIGLGIMGSAIGANLAKTGPVLGYDVTSRARDRWPRQFRAR